MGAALLAHGASLQAEFFLDDYLHLVGNVAVETGRWWEVPFRQFSYIFFCAIHAMFGASPVAFHAWTLLLHLGVTAAVFGVGRRLLRDAGGGPGRADVAAFAGTLLFACHPLLTESVNYAQNASLEMVTLLTVLAVGCVWRFLREERVVFMAAAVGLLVLASASKEVGMIFCGAAIGMVLFVLGIESRWLRGAFRRPAARWGVAGGVLLVLVVAWPLWHQWFRLTLAQAQQPVWLRHAFTQGRIFWDYVGAFFWPANLCADHHVPLSGIIRDPESLIKTCGVLVVAIAVGAGLVFRRTRVTAVIAALALLPMLFRLVYVGKEFHVEYRAYPAAPWAALLVGCVFARLWAWKRTPALAVGVAVMAACIVTSARRSFMWGDRYAFAESIIRQYPTNLRARTALQKYDYEEGRWAAVMRRTRECRAAMGEIEKFNEQAPNGRAYELSMAYRCAMCSEHFYALALAEVKGAAAGLAHVNGTIDGLRAFNPAFLNPNNPEFEIGRQLVETRAILEAVGPASARLQSHPSDPAVRAEVDRLRAATMKGAAAGP